VSTVDSVLVKIGGLQENGRAKLLIPFNLRDYRTAPARFGIEVMTPREAVERIRK
jgi:hypothetical protein